MVVAKLRGDGDYSRTLRDIARLSRCSVGAVHKTLAWRIASTKKSEN
jgi:hypothetical protein